ncbi:histidine phosphatase family protein [Aquibacillus kalidii]|uniref:histidine phosphatase family protein n=1 Tax=Aquibacillus kalidii TaxID=2762597 RepID=UPI001645B819|nr:histidine phosphatase family protein [Aquibacillus kalidii]
MKTFIYMVRHGDSPKEGNERTRGLTEKGKKDAERVSNLLKTEGIHLVFSSPYTRSILTVQQLTDEIGRDVIVEEDLKERVFSNQDKRISDKELIPLINKSYLDPSFSIYGGESNNDCQNRAVKVLNGILDAYKGKKIVIGTHGAVMSLMMGHYDENYALDFLYSTSKPDIYRMEFSEQKLIKVERLWGSSSNSILG